MFGTFTGLGSLAAGAVHCFKNFLDDEGGSVAIEYGVIVLLMAIAIVGTLFSIGETLRDGYFAEVDAGLNQAAGAN